MSGVSDLTCAFASSSTQEAKLKAADYIRSIVTANGDKDAVVATLTQVVTDALLNADRTNNPRGVLHALRGGHQMWLAICKPFVSKDESAAHRMQDMYVQALGKANPYLLAMCYFNDFPLRGRAVSDPDQRSHVFKGYVWRKEEIDVINPLMTRVLGKWTADSSSNAG
jgi:hypothetical protein